MKKKKARRRTKSFNAQGNLEENIFPESTEKLYHDLDYLAGTWEEDPAFDEAIALQDRIVEDLWR